MLHYWSTTDQPLFQADKQSLGQAVFRSQQRFEALISSFNSTSLTGLLWGLHDPSGHNPLLVNVEYLTSASDLNSCLPTALPKHA